MEICWTANYNMRGNGYGYTMHQKNLKAALERAGVVMSEDADVAVHITTPPSFKPLEGKFNVLYTMYEMARLPDEWPEKLHGADMLVVPNHHNKHLFAQSYSGPIEVVWEGVKPEKFELRKRERNGEPFRFLWVGASNPRKGYEHICVGWEKFLKDYPDIRDDVELYLKTTQPDTEKRYYRIPEARTIFDNRDIELYELIGLYHSAHAFVFPSMGEGWGLTLHEAMATGLPALYTNWSAMRDWVPHKYAYEIKHGMKTIDAMKRRDNGESYVYHSAPAANPDITHMVRKMRIVYGRQKEAFENGYKAGEIVRGITWDRSAREFLDKVTPYVTGRVAA